ncbi:MAG: hypothetical protein RLZZ540_1159 [Bacteroidota bacterium]|jgi:gas vesicle protein
MNSSKVLLGILGGVAAGALVGILFAPDKGIKTRKKIISKANGGKAALKDKYDSLLDSVSEKYENIWQAKDELVTDGQARLDAVKKELKNL